MSDVKKNPVAIPGVLVFELSGNQFCVDIRDVHGFLDITNLGQDDTRTLTKKTYFEYFNRQIPFINLHKIFKLHEKVLIEDARILFYEHKGMMMCFLADRIVEFIAFDDKITAQQTITNSNNYLPSDYLHYDGKTFLYPHYNRLLKHWKTSNQSNKIKSNRRRCVMPGKNTLPP